MLLLISVALGALPALTRQSVSYCLVVGALAYAAPFGIFAYVASHLPAGVVALVGATVPGITYVVAVAVGMAAMNSLSIIGLLLGLAGLLVLVVPQSSLPDPRMARWVAIALLSSVSAGAVNVFAERFRPNSSSTLALACGTLLGAAAVLFPVMLLVGQGYFFSIPFALPDWVVLIAIAISAVNLCLFFEIVRRAGAVFFSQFNYVVVPSGMLWGALLFRERQSGWIWLSIVLTLGGIALVNAGGAGSSKTGALRRLS